MHDLKQSHTDQPAVVAWVQAIHALSEEATLASAGTLPRRRWRRRDFELRLEQRVLPVARQKKIPHAVLAQRIRGHLLEWFVFVEYPEVPSTNNLAERRLRPAVIARKISGGTRSEKGSHTKMGLMSLLATWAAQGQALLPACQHLLLTGLPAGRVEGSPA